MKKLICLAVTLLVSGLIPVFGQPIIRPPTPMRVSTPEEQIILTEPKRITDPNSTPSLTKFNLDFSGGTPGELVKAIEKATGKPLNVIIPPEYAETQIPALKMSHVDVPQLFKAVVNMSYKYAPTPDRYGGRDVVSSYGFETKDQNISDDSIWNYFVYTARPSPKVCQFYSLIPYLDRGYTVDDITTAIKTGWKMSGETAPPDLSYHKETKLLIAYGEPDKLQTIESVLKSLQQQNTVTTRPQLIDLENKINQLDKLGIDNRKKLNELIQQLSKQEKVLVSPEEKSGK